MPTQAAAKMADLGLGCLIVVDAEARAVGIVTDRDLTLRVVARTMDPDASSTCERS